MIKGIQIRDKIFIEGHILYHFIWSDLVLNCVNQIIYQFYTPEIYPRIILLETAHKSY